jgi:hypothetical protein
MKIQEFPSGMTVKDLKESIKDWPEFDENGDPCEVWIETMDGRSNQASGICLLNKRMRDNGDFTAADVLLCVKKAPNKRG